MGMACDRHLTNWCTTHDRSFQQRIGRGRHCRESAVSNRLLWVVIAADTVEHVFDLRAALLEVRRVLVNGGYFALSVPTPNSLPKWAYNRFIGQRPSPILFAKLLYTILARAVLFGHPAFQPIDRDLSVDEWHELITQAGFVIEQSVSWPQPPLKAIVHLFGARAGAEQ